MAHPQAAVLGCALAVLGGLGSTAALAEPMGCDNKLAQQLLASPAWRLETSRERTLHKFRCSDEQQLEHLRNADVGGGNWRRVETGDGGSFGYDTRNGHRITFLLDGEGRPKATHSKYEASLQRVPE